MKPTVPSATEVRERLLQASRASDLRASTRLDAKLDLSPDGVRRRLVEASDLLEACRSLAATKPSRR